MALFSILTLLIATISKTLAQSISASELNQIYQSLNRDGYGRANPNEILNGFFPAWAILLLCLSGIFAFTAIVSFVCFKLGCVNPQKSQIRIQKQ